MPEEQILKKLDLISNKLDDHDQKFDSISNKLGEHDQKFDLIFNKLEEHDQKFDEIAEKFVDHEQKFDGIINKLIEHDDKFEKMDEKFDNYHRENLDKQDKIITILQRLDQERIFTGEWIQRIEKEVEQHTLELKEVKLRLNMA